MNPIRSIRGRLDGVAHDLRSRYWEYIRYYNDGVLWDRAILFESFNGKNFQGNPYYLFREALAADECAGFTIYIAHRQPEDCLRFLERRGLSDARVRVILYGSAEYRKVLSHAKYLVNNVSFPMDWIKKDGQVYLNTWHGTPLKTLGRNIKNDPFELNNSQRNMLLADILLAPNVLTRRVFSEDYMLHDVMPGTLIMGGYPRNTAFFREEERETVRRKHGLTDKTMIFYMPTWRGTASEVRRTDCVSEMERLAEELGERFAVYVKLHPAMTQGMGALRLCHPMPEEYEVYEFLNAADLLITDYSSVYFDFANTGRRTILYQYDRDAYFSDRGVYPEVLEATPYPVVETYDALKREILSGSRTDAAAFRKTFCGMDAPDSGAVLLHSLLRRSPEPMSQQTDLYVISFPVTDGQLLRWKEQLEGQNYRFVFVPRRSNRRFSNVTCFDRIDYLSCWDGGRLIGAERLLAGRAAALRERKRLWGDLNVGRVFARPGRLPLPLRPGRENWPEELN